ncbi:sugar porter family MFS transporter [Kovacikia minuta CCNUW1]|uniref:sugar porter family MFS transporter n=1 Tax=Kovacikia minuta TaxID=2931930 RepID=UPI001CCE33F4|nr:sugar porter family MFS transporter [Kovacikia minuta]UBF27993.1 sugar porter family MFS transporter [Kovacikia minuta CCNUW1]
MTHAQRNQDPLDWGYLFPIFAVAGMAGILFGFDQGIWNVVSKFLLESFDIDATSAAGATEEGFAVSILYLGALLGALLSGYSTSRVGRRRSLMMSASSFLLGIFFYAIAPTMIWIVIGRILMGFGIGIAAMAAPLYLSEVSPPQVRGAAVAGFQLAITLGILLTSLIGLVYQQLENWRVMVAFGLLPTTLFFAGLFITPDSPRWLISKGRSVEATSILMKLLNKQNVSSEVREIQNSTNRVTTGSFGQLFTPRIFPLVIVAFGLFVFQQLSGVNVFFTYSTSIFEKAGLPQSASYLSTFGLGAVNVLATLLSMWVIDRIGRRSLLLIGFAGAVACLLSLGYLLNTNNTSFLLVIACFAYVTFFAVGLGPTPYLLMAEIFPLSLRGTAMAFSSCANWLLNGLVVGLFPELSIRLGTGNAFYLFAACSIVAFIFVYFMVPETRGVSLESIEENLYKGKTTRHLGDPIRKPQHVQTGI